MLSKRGREVQHFIKRMALEGVDEGTARKLTRYAMTLHRLAEAQCNGDWPCDNGVRPVAPCGRCELLWVHTVLKGKHNLCPDCRTEDLVTKALAPFPGIKPAFHGDPRGAVLRLHVPSGYDEGWGGVAVP